MGKWNESQQSSRIARISSGECGMSLDSVSRLRAIHDPSALELLRAHGVVKAIALHASRADVDILHVLLTLVHLEADREVRRATLALLALPRLRLRLVPVFPVIGDEVLATALRAVAARAVDLPSLEAERAAAALAPREAHRVHRTRHILQVPTRRLRLGTGYDLRAESLAHQAAHEVVILAPGHLELVREAAVTQVAQRFEFPLADAVAHPADVRLAKQFVPRP